MTVSSVLLPTIAALRAATTTTVLAEQVSIQGYAANGDGGEGVFWYDSGDTTSADNGGTIIVDASSRRWYRETGGQPYSVKWFGAKGDGATNDTAAIQAAITAVVSGEVWLPASNYLISAQINLAHNGLSLRGAGQEATTITCSSATQNGIVLGYGGGFQNINVSGLTVAYSVTATGGAGLLYAPGNSLLCCRDVSVTGGYISCVMNGNSTNSIIYKLEDFYFDAPALSGIQIGEGTDTGLLQDVFISNGNIGSAGAVGIEVDNVSGLYLSKVDVVLSGTHGMSFNPSSTTEVVFCFFDTLLLDSSTDNGVIFYGSYLIADIQFVNCWAAGSGQNGVILSNTLTNGVSWKGGVVRDNGYNGFSLGSVLNMQIEGVSVFNNSKTGSGTYHGIAVSAGVSNFSIRGGFSGLGGYDGAKGTANYQGYGVLVSAGASNNYIIADVLTIGNVTGGVSDGGTGANKFVGNNVA